MSTVGRLHPALTGRKNSQQLYVDAQRGKNQKNPAVSTAFGLLRSSLSLTYLRHSVSAQADCCPDVVDPLLHTAPFIAANIQN